MTGPSAAPRRDPVPIQLSGRQTHNQGSAYLHTALLYASLKGEHDRWQAARAKGAVKVNKTIRAIVALAVVSVLAIVATPLHGLAKSAPQASPYVPTTASLPWLKT